MRIYILIGSIEDEINYEYDITRSWHYHVAFRDRHDAEAQAQALMQLARGTLDMMLEHDDWEDVQDEYLKIMGEADPEFEIPSRWLLTSDPNFEELPKYEVITLELH